MPPCLAIPGNWSGADKGDGEVGWGVLPPVPLTAPHDSSCAECRQPKSRVTLKVTTN